MVLIAQIYHEESLLDMFEKFPMDKNGSWIKV